MYRLKHIPTGLYYQPLKHRGSHLSKSGKIYQTNSNGIFTGLRAGLYLNVYAAKNSRIQKDTSNVLEWLEVSYASGYQVYAKTLITDWVKENI